jgi:uncharacterized protein (TIGR02231 family)
MKKIIALIQLSLLTLFINADEIPASSKITEVTVYRNQAKESRILTVTIPKGNSDVVIPNISIYMVDNSLQVGVKGSATLLSATTRINYFLAENAAPKDPKSDRLKDSLKTFDLDLQWINEQKLVYTGETELIQNNIKLGSGKEGMKPADLIALSDFYRSRLMDLKKKLFDLTNRENKLTDKRNKFQEQLDEMGVKKIDPAKEIVLSFSSETGGVITIRPSYLVTQASWAPMYDIKVANISQPVSIFYKAKIYQKTGSDWKDVKITISSANPSQNNNRPIMSPKFIDYITYAVRNDGYLSNAPAAMNMMQMEKKAIAEKDFKLEDESPNYQVNVNENDINVEFEIDIKQNIPSDGKEHICAIQTYNVPATYKYHAVPKLDQSAFLLAKITDYGKYNLLAGQANIFFDDMYIGQTLLNPQVSSDTLLISLGRDERIVVKRNKIVDKASKKILTDSQKDTYVYEIIIRNNKSTAIDIEVLDQIPISKRTEIEVELLEKQNAEYSEEYGKLLWNFKIKPNESQKIKLSYSVKYPKGKVVQEQ